MITSTYYPLINKILGIYTGNSLNWKEDVHYGIKRINTKFYVIFKKILGTKIFIDIYYIISKLNIYVYDYFRGE